MSGAEGGGSRSRPTVLRSSRPRPPAAVRWIVRTLEGAGYETWAVGGAVRDAFVGRSHEDWDLATRARPDEIRRIFPRTVPIGVEHGTVGVLSRQGVLFEVTTFRRDVETWGRHARVAFSDTVEEDLARRDFTINALAWHPLREELLDPYHGLDDLEEGVLRTVGDPKERFREDYLRVLRALRFAGDFGLQVEEESWEALCSDREKLLDLSAERIREELMKILGAAARPSAALSLWAASGALEVVCPELRSTVGMGPSDGGPGDAWGRGLLTADALPATRPLLRLSAVVAATGLPDAGDIRPPGGARDPGTGEAWERGALRSAALLERLRFSNAEVRDVGGLVENLLRPVPDPSDPASVRRWLLGVERHRAPSLFRILLARGRVDRRRGVDGAGERAVALVRSARRGLRSGAPLSVGELEAGGRELKSLGLRPGPHFGTLLERLLEWTLEDPGRNRRDALLEEAERLVASGEVEVREGRGG